MSNAYRPFEEGSPYGKRIDPFTGKDQFHAGVDFKAPEGTRVPAAGTGRVVFSGFNRAFGNTVIIHNDAGDYSLYAHLSNRSRMPAYDQAVTQGDTIGLVGATGERAKGPHLHYSVIPEALGKSITPAQGGSARIGIGVDEEHTENPAEHTNYTSWKSANQALPNLAQSLQADQTFATHNASNPAALSPGEIDRFYAETSNPGIDPLASLGKGVVAAVPYPDATDAMKRLLPVDGPAGGRRSSQMESNKAPISPAVAPERGSFGDRFGNWISSSKNLDPSLALPIPPAPWPLRIAGGGSEPLRIEQMPLFGTAAPPDDAVWPPVPASGSWDADRSSTSAFDAGVPGGQLGMLSALAGIDPRAPNRFAPSLLDDALRGFTRTDLGQPWSVQR